MQQEQDFIREMTEGYRFSSESIVLGTGMLDRKLMEGVTVSVPLRVMNRHGLIAGATGTGKTVMIGGISMSGADAANYTLQNTSTTTTATSF